MRRWVLVVLLIAPVATAAAVTWWVLARRSATPPQGESPAFETFQEGLEAAASLAESKQFDQAEAVYRKLLETNPRSGDAHMGLAWVNTQQEDYDGALAEYQAATEASPASPDAWRGVGGCLVEQGDWDLAVEAVREAVKRNSSDPRTHDLLGYALAHTGQYDEAIEELRTALHLDDTRALTRQHLAWALTCAGHMEEAEAELQRQLALDPKKVWTHRALGWLDQRGRRYADAAAHYRYAVDSDPSDHVTHLRLGRVLQCQGRYAEAWQAFGRAADLEPHDPYPHAGLAELFSEAEAHVLAVEEAHKAVALDSDRASLRQTLVKTLLAAQRWQEALDEIKAFRAMLPDGALCLADSHRAEALTGMGSHTKSIGLAEQTVRYGPTESWFRMVLGEALEAAGRDKEAEECYRQVLDAEPGTIRARADLARLLWREGHQDAAVAQFAEAVERYSGDQSLRLELAEALLSAERDEAALAEAERVYQLGPISVSVHSRLARVFREAGDPSRAEALLRDAGQAVDAAPSASR